MDAKKTDKRYKYYAFISYKRKEERSAKNLHSFLENRSIPAGISLPDHVDSKKRLIRPIFRDKTDLSVTNDDHRKGLAKALRESRFLIVQCSPKSAKSENVEWEIRYFIDYHGLDYALNHIVPVIISGRPNCGDPQDECFAPSLRELDVSFQKRNHPNIDASGNRKDLTKEDWEGFFLQCQSFLLNVEYSTLNDRFQRHQRAKMRKYVIFAVIICLCLAALTAWALIERNRADLQVKSSYQTNLLVARYLYSNDFFDYKETDYDFLDDLDADYVPHYKEESVSSFYHRVKFCIADQLDICNEPKSFVIDEMIRRYMSKSESIEEKYSISKELLGYAEEDYHGDSIIKAICKINVANCLYQKGLYKDTALLYMESIEMLKRLIPEDNVLIMEYSTNLATCLLFDLGIKDVALDYFLDVRDMLDKFGDINGYDAHVYACIQVCLSSNNKN